MRRKVILYSVTTIIALLSTTGCTFSDTFRSSFIGASKFNKINPDLYVSPQISSAGEQEIIKLLSAARARVKNRFGTPVSTPTIIITSGVDEQKQFKLYQAPGKLLIAPWGNYLILDHDQASIDVAAHELVHAEIAEYLGYVARMRRMPTWLDEGIALQVDHRLKYTNLEEIDNPELKRVMSLSSPALFWTGDSNQNIKNYQSSKVAVSRVVQPTLAEKGLYGILDEIKAGKALETIIDNQ